MKSVSNLVQVEMYVCISLLSVGRTVPRYRQTKQVLRAQGDTKRAQIRKLEIAQVKHLSLQKGYSFLGTKKNVLVKSNY